MPAATSPANYGTGRRKTSTARVHLRQGTGKITINGRELNDYFTNERDRKGIFGPLEVTGTGGKLDVHARCTGGGATGQAGAVVMGLARALLKYDANAEAALRGAHRRLRFDIRPEYPATVQQA